MPDYATDAHADASITPPAYSSTDADIATTKPLTARPAQRQETKAEGRR